MELKKALLIIKAAGCWVVKHREGEGDISHGKELVPWGGWGLVGWGGFNNFPLIGLLVFS